MREFKFRGKDIDQNKWRYGNYFTMAEPDGTVLHCILEVDGQQWIICPDSVGQYTGLKDENGIEIYEGDILELQNENETKNSYISQVYINAFGVRVAAHPAHISMGIGTDRALMDYIDYGVGYQYHLKCKKLGNIYENPELLK